MKVISGDFGENRDAKLRKGWLGEELARIEVSGWFYSCRIKASEIKEVQVIADNSKNIPGNLSGTTGGAVVGLIAGGPVGLAIGALLGTGLNKKSSVEKSLAVLVQLTDGRQFVGTCDLAEFGLLSAASSKQKSKRKK